MTGNREYNSDTFSMLLEDPKNALQVYNALNGTDYQDEEAIDETIEECIKEHILEDFLRRRGSEVKKSMTIDMTFERREKLIREEEREEGRLEGIRLEQENTKKAIERAEKAEKELEELKKQLKNI